MTSLWKTVLSSPELLIWPAVVFGITFVVGAVARRLLLRGLESWSSRTSSSPSRILIRSLRGPSIIWTLILALHTAIQSSDLPHRVTELWAPRLLAALVVLSFTIMAVRMVGELVRHYGAQAPGALPVTALSETLAQMATLLLGILVLLEIEHVNITPILTALGVGGLAVALALQSTLSNLFAGFYVAVSRQVRLGDYVKLSTGEEGYVSDITWRSTTIRSLNNNLIFVPNSKLAEANLTNYWLPEKRMSASLKVGVAYDSDIEQVERVLLEIAQQAATEIPGMLADPPPAVTFDPGFGESSLDFTLAFQVEEFTNQYRARHELRKRILKRFRQEGLQMPYPTRTVYLEGGAGEKAQA